MGFGVESSDRFSQFAGCFWSLRTGMTDRRHSLAGIMQAVARYAERRHIQVTEAPGSGLVLWTLKNKIQIQGVRDMR